MTFKSQNDIENEDLRKKIVGILVDYKYNDTRTETTEMFADKIIEIVSQSKEKDVKEFIRRRIERTKLICNLYPHKTGEELAGELNEDLIKDAGDKLKEVKND